MRYRLRSRRRRRRARPAKELFPTLPSLHPLARYRVRQPRLAQILKSIPALCSKGHTRLPRWRSWVTMSESETLSRFIGLLGRAFWERLNCRVVVLNGPGRRRAPPERKEKIAIDSGYLVSFIVCARLYRLHKHGMKRTFTFPMTKVFQTGRVAEVKRW